MDHVAPGWWDIDWGTAGTWFGAIATLLGAIGTVAAVVVALTTTKHARETAIQAQETANVARQDAISAREETNAEKRVAQARRVSAWYEKRRIERGWPIQVVRLSNTSPEPVYSVVTYLVWVQGAGPKTGEETEESDVPIHRMRAIAQVLPPGEFAIQVPGPSPLSAPSQGVLGVEVAFTDSAGRHWVRRVPSGELAELHEAPVAHYRVGRPFRYNEISALASIMDELKSPSL